MDAELFDRLMAVAESWTGARVRAESLSAISSLAQVIRDAAATLEASARAIRGAIPINALPRPDLRLRHPPIWISTEEAEDGTFVAELPEVGAVGYGETATDAAEAAIDSLCDIYEELRNSTAESLGARPARWLVSLQSLIERVNG
jgi:hypothetical protein